MKDVLLSEDRVVCNSNGVVGRRAGARAGRAWGVRSDPQEVPSPRRDQVPHMPQGLLWVRLRAQLDTLQTRVG